MTSSFYLSDELQIPDATAANNPAARFWEALGNHSLIIQQCTNCGVGQNPAEFICHACYASTFEWIELPTRGRVFSWTRVWHSVHESLNDKVPYLLVWVEIDHKDRPRFLGNLLGDPLQEVRLDMEVEGSFEDHAGGTLLQWTAL